MKKFLVITYAKKATTYSLVEAFDFHTAIGVCDYTPYSYKRFKKTKAIRVGEFKITIPIGVGYFIGCTVGGEVHAINLEYSEIKKVSMKRPMQYD